MSIASIVLLIFFSAIILIVLALGLIVYSKVKNTYNSFFGNVPVNELLDMREQEMENTQKSIAGMESLERPKIQSDFPDMSIDELKSRDTDEIYAYYHALSTGDFERYRDMHLFNDQMRSTITSAQQTGYSLSAIKVHRQSISSYKKTENSATINIQTSLEGMKKTKILDDKKTQLRVETQWVYVINSDNFNNSLTATLNCPNCGAPVADLAGKFCEHCGSDVTIDYSRSWQLSSIKEC